MRTIEYRYHPTLALIGATADVPDGQAQALVQEGRAVYVEPSTLEQRDAEPVPLGQQAAAVELETTVPEASNAEPPAARGRRLVRADDPAS